MLKVITNVLIDRVVDSGKSYIKKRRIRSKLNKKADKIQTRAEKLKALREEQRELKSGLKDNNSIELKSLIADYQQRIESLEGDLLNEALNLYDH